MKSSSGCPTANWLAWTAMPAAWPRRWSPRVRSASGNMRCAALGESAMTLGTILIIILVIFLLGGFSGRFRGYGYGYGHSGMGLVGVILIILLILVLLGKL